MQRLSQVKAHGGSQEVWRHASTATRTDMTFAVYLPPQAAQAKVPVVWYLSGLTCTHANVMDKGEYRRTCSELGLALVAPDTSPRGDAVPTDPEGRWDFGHGAGFYVDATQAPYAANYRMWSYVTQELPALVTAAFNVDPARQAIMGHSMGGHGALTAALRLPGRYASASAFAPIVAPSQVPWGQRALTGYLGADARAWRGHDAVALIEDGARHDHLRVDQGEADVFLQDELRPELLRQACQAHDVPLTLQLHPGYDHSYAFVSTFMDDQLRWHAARLRG